MYISITIFPTYFLLGWQNVSQKRMDHVTSRLLTSYFKRSKQTKNNKLWHTLFSSFYPLSYAPRPSCLGIYWIPEPNSNKPDLKIILSSIFICSPRQLTPRYVAVRMSGYTGHKEGLVSAVIPSWGKLCHKLSSEASFCFTEHVWNLGIWANKTICEQNNILVENSSCSSPFSTF